MDDAKQILLEYFGTEKMPKELLQQTLDIRRGITARSKTESYVSELSTEDAGRIRNLAHDIAHFKGEGAVLPPDQEAELTETLTRYFDAFREAENAHVFRDTLRETKQEIIHETEIGKRNFYSEEERQEFVEKEFPQKLLLGRLQEKYGKAGFTEEEIKDLITLCDIEDLQSLPLHKIQTIKHTNELFRRYLGGERGKYLALSVALMIPALLRGIAPALLADAFKGSDVDITHIGLYGLSEIMSTGATIGINAWFEKFMQGNVSKEGGFNEYMAENFAYFPGGSIREFGEDAIRRRAGNAQQGYESVMRNVSYNLLPTITTLLTSIAVLSYKDPKLAVGTIAGAGLMLMLDRQLQKRGKFWKKRKDVERRAEELSHALSEQMSAHLETVLSGEKDQLQERLEKLMREARSADAQENVLQMVQDNISRFFGVFNAFTAAIVTYLTNGGSSGFVAALVYSGNFSEGMRTMLDMKRRLQRDLRSIMEMELMFNGHAKEEKGRELERVGMDEVQGNDIVLDDITVQYRDRKILDRASARIPGGSFCSIQGQSGGGKSTLLKIMSGYYTPTKGQAFFGTRETPDDSGKMLDSPVPVQDIKKSGPDAIYRKIAYLSQFPYIFDGSIKDNLLFGVKGDVPEEELKAILQEVGLTQRFPNLQEKLTSGRGDQSGTSGGETSRIGLARTLLKIRTEKSRVVYLDEPTASVDAATKKDIARILNQEKINHPETTFVVISHDTEFLEQLNLDQTITSSRGKLRTEKISRRSTPPRSLPPAS